MHKIRTYHPVWSSRYDRKTESQRFKTFMAVLGILSMFAGAVLLIILILTF